MKVKETKTLINHLMLILALLIVLPVSMAMADGPGADGNYPNPDDAGVTTADVTISTYAPDGASAAALANILLLADTPSAGTPALVSALTAAGYTVTVFAPEYNWNGSPSLAGFQCVIHLNGQTYWRSLSVSAQTALVSFVQSGGCFVGTQWNGYARHWGQQTAMNDLVLQGWPGSQQFGFVTLTTVAGQAGHAVLASIASPVSLNGGWLSPGPQYSYAVNPSTVLMRSSSGEPAVLARLFGNGCVVNLAFALNYSGSQGLNDPIIQRLFINSLNWGTSSSCGNQPPTADAGGSYSGDEGSPISIAGTASDAENDPLTYAWSYTAGAGVDTGATCAFGNASALSTDITCTDDGTYNLTLTVSDGTASASDSTTVDVANVAPDLGAISVDQTLVPMGTTINASASFSDDGSNDTHTAAWNWGDGNTTGPAGATSPAMASNTYNTPGVYTVELTVTDDGTGSDSSTFEYVVVYDPDGGFVTGGGWIDSPSGAYTPDDPNDEDFTGRANFGFVSKYKRGADAPTGKTEFQFKAAGLNFHSDTYQWLVVAGAHAKFKGDGTINGTDGYGFMLTATDGQANGGGGVDRFRIKIWDEMGTEDESDDVVMYDNQPDEDDDSNEGSVLGGGSIVVHTKGK